MVRPQIITYDLRKPGRDYASLYRAIEGVGGIRLLESVWLVHTSYDSIQLRDHLKNHIDMGDGLAVLPISEQSGWATFGVEKPAVTWMHANL